MINSILTEIIQKLSKNGTIPVYSAFDAVSVERKNKDFFTIVGIDSFELQTPIYSEFTIFVPYKANVDINVTAPEKFPLSKLYQYFSENIKPAVIEISGLNCIKKIYMKHDSNINRFVLNSKLSVNGMDKFERGNI